MPAPPPAPRRGLWSRGPLRHLRVSDLRGLAQLATQAGLEAARIAEELQSARKPVPRDAAGAGPEAAPPVPPRADLRLDRTLHPYSGLRGFVRLSGQGVDAVLAGVEGLLAATGRHPPETPERASALAALNALAGQPLAAAHNPLATRMVLLHHGQPLRNHQMPPEAAASGRVLLMVHGWGATERVWQMPARGPQAHAGIEGHGMGEALGAALGCTVLHLRYNSGLRTADNGRELAAALEALLARWPVPLAELAIVAHGRGGLVARSAVHCARQQSAWRWPQRLRHLVFLGTPHHELAPEDAAALPEGVACCAVAGALPGPWAGDGVVSVAAALGRHPDPRRSLVFARDAQYVAPRTHHLQLARSAEVARRIVGWLQAG